MQPLMTAKINDATAQFVVDSGRVLQPSEPGQRGRAETENIARSRVVFKVKGVHGAADEVSIAKVQSFELSGATLHNVEFLVGGSEVGQGSMGVLGQNFLHIADVEYDLGGGAIRLISPENCSKSFLAYWAGDTTPYSIVDLQSEPSLNSGSADTLIRRKLPQLSHTIGSAYVNGTRISVLFDTGRNVFDSVGESRGARRHQAGLPGVVNGGMSYGVGKEFFATYLVPVSSFRIGQEEIRNTRIRIGDIEVSNADMLIGADFFLSHRIFVANSQMKLYFTYNGGPVFNLSTTDHPAGGAAVDTAPQATADAVSGAGADSAADFGRRGAAFAAGGSSIRHWSH